MGIRKQDPMWKALTGAGILVLLGSLAACDRNASLQPKTCPSAVPSDAVWVGGADGGAYVRCAVDLVHNVNPCSVGVPGKSCTSANETN